MRPLRLALCLLASSLLPAPAAPSDAPESPPAATSWSRPGGPRLRPQDDRTAMLLQEGLLRSATVRRLAARLEAGDVIVYLERQPRLAARLSGCVTWMGHAGGFRYLRASVAPQLPIESAITAVAHELAHAVEVLEAAAVTDERALVALYRRIGFSPRDNARALESEAAMTAGADVRRELRAMPAAVVASALEPLSVARWPAWYRRQLERAGA
jgi:hypothetical protein